MEWRNIFCQKHTLYDRRYQNFLSKKQFSKIPITKMLKYQKRNEKNNYKKLFRGTTLVLLFTKFEQILIQVNIYKLNT